MGFQVKDLYTKSGEELITLLFSEQGLRENAVEFTEYVNKVGVLEVLDSNLRDAILNLEVEDYVPCYLRCVEYALEFMKDVREKEKGGKKVPEVPAMWNILQSAVKTSDYDYYQSSCCVYAKALEEFLSTTDRIFEYAYATNVNFCSRCLGSDSMITDGYMDHILNKYHYAIPDKDTELKDFSVNHLENLMKEAGIPEDAREKQLRRAKEKLEKGNIIGPMFMRMTKIDKDDIEDLVGSSFMEALQERSQGFDDFFADEEAEIIKGKSSSEEEEKDPDEIPKDESGNTLQ